MATARDVTSQLQNLASTIGDKFAQDLTNELGNGMLSVWDNIKGAVPGFGRDLWGISDLTRVEKLTKKINKENTKFLKMKKEGVLSAQEEKKLNKEIAKLEKERSKATLRHRQSFLTSIPVIGNAFEAEFRKQEHLAAEGLETQKSFVQSITSATSEVGKGILDNITSLKTISALIIGAFTLMIGLTKKVVETIKQGIELSIEWYNELQKITSSFQLSVGVSINRLPEVKKVIQDTYVQNAYLFESMGDVSQIASEIALTFRELPENLQEVVDETNKFGRILFKDTQQAVELMRILEKSFGADALNKREKYYNRFYKWHVKSGVPLKAITEGYKQQINLVSRLGNVGDLAFYNMLKLSQKLNIQMEKFAEFSESLWNIEDVIPVISKINMMFGTSISAMDVFAEDDPTKKLALIVDHMKTVGIRWEGLTRFHKKALVDWLHFSEIEIQAMFKSTKAFGALIEEQNQKLKEQADWNEMLKETQIILFDMGKAFLEVKFHIAKTFKGAWMDTERYNKELERTGKLTEQLTEGISLGDFWKELSKEVQNFLKDNDETFKAMVISIRKMLKDVLVGVQGFFKKFDSKQITAIMGGVTKVVKALIDSLGELLTGDKLQELITAVVDFSTKFVLNLPTIISSLTKMAGYFLWVAKHIETIVRVLLAAWGIKSAIVIGGGVSKAIPFVKDMGGKFKDMGKFGRIGTAALIGGGIIGATALATAGETGQTAAPKRGIGEDAFEGAIYGAILSSVVAPFLGPAAPFATAIGAICGAIYGAANNILSTSNTVKDTVNKYAADATAGMDIFANAIKDMESEIRAKYAEQMSGVSESRIKKLEYDMNAELGKLGKTGEILSGEMAKRISPLLTEGIKKGEITGEEEAALRTFGAHIPGLSKEISTNDLIDIYAKATLAAKKGDLTVETIQKLIREASLSDNKVQGLLGEIRKAIQSQKILVIANNKGLELASAAFVD